MNPVLIALVLICSSNIPKEGCTKDNATDVLRGEATKTPMECFMSAQALIASTALSLEGQYIKIVCEQASSHKVMRSPIAPGLVLGGGVEGAF